MRWHGADDDGSLSRRSLERRRRVVPRYGDRTVLILSRKIGEQICIGDGIVVTVLRIAGARVKLGVECQKEIAVDRHEIHELRQREREDAA